MNSPDDDRRADTGTDNAGDNEATPAPDETSTPDALFGSREMEQMKSEQARQKERDEEKKRQAAAASKDAQADAVYPAGTELRYAGHSRTYEADISSSEIFDDIADDFPEIDPKKFTLRYDKDKGRVVPIPNAQKKGTVGTAAAEGRPLSVLARPPQGAPPPVYRLLGADGVYEVRTNLSGTYTVKLPAAAEVEEGFQPAAPTPPAELLRTVIRCFADYPSTEALIDIVYDSHRGRFHPVWNQHSATETEVRYQPLPDSDRYILYCEIHSHHSMPAEFSTIDNDAERKSGIYGVVGRIGDPRPEARFRYSCGGHFRRIPASAVFDGERTVAATVREAPPEEAR